jgi:lipid-binding SYLF domain-containing protein
MLPDPGVHETRSRFGRNVWVNGVSLEPALAREAGLLKCALRSDVFGVAGRLHPIYSKAVESTSRQRCDRLRHDAFAPVPLRQYVADIDGGAKHAGINRSNCDIIAALGNHIRQATAGVPCVHASLDVRLRNGLRGMRRPRHEVADFAILRVRSKNRARVGGLGLAQAKPFGVDQVGQEMRHRYALWLETYGGFDRHLIIQTPCEMRVGMTAMHGSCSSVTKTQRGRMKVRVRAARAYRKRKIRVGLSGYGVVKGRMFDLGFLIYQRPEDLMQKRTFLLKTTAALAFAALALGGCSTTTDTSATTGRADNAAARTEIQAGVDSTLTRLYTQVSGSRELVNKADGVLVFPRVLAAGFVVGGEYGRGELRIKGKHAGYYSLASLSIGFQAGAQSKAMVVLFMTKEALDKFRSNRGGWNLGADASVALVKVGANGQIDTTTATQPVQVIVLTNAGLMANLSLEGTKITPIDL